MKRELNELKVTVAGIAATLERTNAMLVRSNERLEHMDDKLDHTNSMLKRTMITVAQLSGDMSEVKHELATNVATKKDLSELNARMDGFSGLLLDSRHRWAVHAETLSSHDSRLKKLEAPQA